MKSTTTTNTTTDRRGQAAVEAAVGLFFLAFVVAAFVAFAELFVNGFEMMQYARRDAGEGALKASSGSASGSSSAFASIVNDLGGSTVPLPPDPWAYPRSVFPNSGLMAQFAGGSPAVLELVTGTMTEDFEIDLRFGDVELFPDELQLKETALIPPMEGL